LGSPDMLAQSLAYGYSILRSLSDSTSRIPETSIRGIFFAS
jgi:hypothetical protein